MASSLVAGGVGDEDEAEHCGDKEGILDLDRGFIGEVKEERKYRRFCWILGMQEEEEALKFLWLNG